MYPVVDIECTDRGITQKADVLEYGRHHLRVVVQGTDLAIDLHFRDNIYIGSKAGLEFICRATFNEITNQKNGS